MLNRTFTLQSLVVAMTLASNIVHATEKTTVDDSDSIESSVVSLTPIVITAQSASSNEASSLIVVTNPKQPIQPIPASDGAAYLKSIMGFNAIANGGTNGDVTFRGMFGSRIKMLNNGTEILGACPARMDAPTSYISPESYDKITVIKGPETVQYATPGSAATVLFERKPPKFEDGKNYQGQASIVVGSFGRLDKNLETSVGNDQFYARLNANTSTANNYSDGNGNKVQSNWDKWNTDLALGWTPDQDTWIELYGGTGNGEAAYAGRELDGSQFKRQSLGLHAEKKNISEHIKKIEAQIDYSDNDHIMDNYSLRTPPTISMMGMTMLNPMSMEVKRKTINSRFAMTTEWGKNWSIISGIDSQYNKHGGDMEAANMPSMNMPYADDMQSESYGLFSEATYKLNQNNKIVTGLRIDRVISTELPKSSEQKREDTLPSGFIRFENKIPSLGLSNYIGIGHVERSPDYWELNSTYILRNNNLIATSSDVNWLKNEKTTQLDFGSTWQHKDFNAWVSMYLGKVNNFIYMDYQKDSSGTLSSARVRNVNATIAGGEFGVGYQITSHLKTNLSTMYAWGENTTNNQPLAQIAPLEGRFNIQYEADRYNFGLLWRVVAAQNRVAISSDQNGTYYGGNIVGYDMSKSKGFGLLSINASYQLTNALGLSLGIDNLFNKAYTEHLNKAGSSTFGYPANTQFNESGRNYWARLNFKF